MTIQQRVRQFVLENFYVSDPAELADDSPLVTTGVVDSTGMLETMAFVETEFGIRIRDDETIPENLESIGRIAAFVARKRHAAVGQSLEDAAALVVTIEPRWTAPARARRGRGPRPTGGRSGPR
jgi:acyl carrier protein